jgi:hypothetical protein
MEHPLRTLLYELFVEPILLRPVLDTDPGFLAKQQLRKFQPARSDEPTCRNFSPPGNLWRPVVYRTLKPLRRSN